MGSVAGLGSIGVIIISLILAVLYVFLGGCIGYFTKMTFKEGEGGE